MLDADLAKLYGVTTSSLNYAVQRNRERFPEDFMFQLSKKETENRVEKGDDALRHMHLRNKGWQCYPAYQEASARCR
jgi:hypothetical protein